MNVLCVFSHFALNVLSVLSVFLQCSLSVLSVFSQCSKCSLSGLWVVSQWSYYVLYLFSECSFSILSLFSLRSQLFVGCVKVLTSKHGCLSRHTWLRFCWLWVLNGFIMCWNTVRLCEERGEERGRRGGGACNDFQLPEAEQRKRFDFYTVRNRKSDLLKFESSSNLTNKFVSEQRVKMF